MYFVISDIHGCLNELNEILEHWDRKKETLIVLGDLVDRGYNSLGTIQRLMELKEKYREQVIILRGNHDDQFVKWLHLDHLDKRRYYYHDLHETLRSFYQNEPERFRKDTRNQRAIYVKRNYPDVVKFLSNLPYYHETATCIFVHAGLNMEISNWKVDKDSMLWIRKEFHYNSKISPKRIFFGHTPTKFLHPEGNRNSIWVSKNGDKIGIDGGCVFGGQLNGLKINPTDSAIIEEITIPNQLQQLLNVKDV